MGVSKIFLFFLFSQYYFSFFSQIIQIRLPSTKNLNKIIGFCMLKSFDVRCVFVLCSKVDFLDLSSHFHRAPRVGPDHSVESRRRRGLHSLIINFFQAAAKPRMKAQATKSFPLMLCTLLSRQGRPRRPARRWQGRSNERKKAAPAAERL